MHPVEELTQWLAECDFGVLERGFAPHGRDYVLVVQDSIGKDPGTHEITFTHTVHLESQTRLTDDVWPLSWSDEFIDYQAWLDADAPHGYVWGAKWSNAYPGLTAIEPSVAADEWSGRLGKAMFEATLETEQYLLRLIFHSIRSRKLNDDVGTMSQVVLPLE